MDIFLIIISKYTYAKFENLLYIIYISSLSLLNVKYIPVSN